MNYNVLYMFLLKYGRVKDLMIIEYESIKYRAKKLKLAELVCANIKMSSDIQKINKEVDEILEFIKEYII